MKQKYYLCDLLNKDSEFYKALINIGVSEDLTSEDMNEREQLAIDISNIITDSLFDKFGSEYLYNELFKDKFRKHNNNTLISFKKQENH
ncbi:MAG: hypothetical protein M0R03_23675, partial [Novosphingobium sp.]|nr:hypothetical protein [Novosphingobium sp.]